jgi:two-component system, NarL family, response regulator NreC
MKTVKIVLADDHHIVRQGVKALLEAEKDFSVIGEAPNGEEAIKLVESLKPDVLVADLIMGGLNGLEVTKHVHKSSPKTNVIILSMYGNEAYVIEALDSGAKGYVLKDSTSEELVQAIRDAMAGKHHLSPPLSEESVEKYRKKTRRSDHD